MGADSSHGITRKDTEEKISERQMCCAWQMISHGITRKDTEEKMSEPQITLITQMVRMGRDLTANGREGRE